MEGRGLELAASAKTEVVFQTKMHIEIEIPMVLGGAPVQTKIATRYSGLMLDKKLSCCDHIVMAAEKAATETTVQSRVMANISYL